MFSHRSRIPIATFRNRHGPTGDSLFLCLNVQKSKRQRPPTPRQSLCFSTMDNAFLALFTSAKLTLVFPMMTGQLRWIWFTMLRSLADFGMFEEACKGLLGAQICWFHSKGVCMVKRRGSLGMTGLNARVVPWFCLIPPNCTKSGELAGNATSDPILYSPVAIQALRWEKRGTGSTFCKLRE